MWAGLERHVVMVAVRAIVCFDHALHLLLKAVDVAVVLFLQGQSNTQKYSLHHDDELTQGRCECFAPHPHPRRGCTRRCQCPWVCILRRNHPDTICSCSTSCPSFGCVRFWLRVNSRHSFTERHYSRKQHRHADHTRRPTPQKPKHSATTLLSALLVLSSLLAMTAAQDQLMAVYKAAVTAHQSQDLTTALDKYREVLKLNPGIAAVQCVSHRPHLEPALSQHC